MAHQKLLLLLIIVTVLSQLSQYAAAFNILAIVSLPLKSHYMAFRTLFRELAIRGHSVTVINNFPETNAPPNLKFVDISVPGQLLGNNTQISEFEREDFAFLHQLANFRRHFVLGAQNIGRDCENLLTNHNIKVFRDKGEKFDVIFVEQFLSDCGLVFAAALYDAPIIGITSHTLLPWAYPRLGIPFDFSSESFYFTDGGTKPSLYKKVEAFMLDFYMKTLGRIRIQDSIYKVFNKYLPNKQLDIEKIATEKIKMMFVNQHHSVTGARLLTPSILEIGGIHIQKPKPVSQDIENYLSSAKHGAIYVSFGSNLKASTMSNKKLQQFLDAFKKIPQKVLWKIENNTLTAGNEDDMFINEWFPQLDILCHPKVLAFVSHGGMLSLSEAAYCGKPLLTIPFFGDQFSNTAVVRESGLGATMYFQDINSDTLSEAIKKIISPKMQENAHRISKLWHDRPQPVMESAIYWTEYVARHKDAPAALPSTRNTWFQSSLLDVYSVLLGIIIVMISVVYLIFMTVKLALVSLFSKLFSLQIKPYEKNKKKRS